MRVGDSLATALLLMGAVPCRQEHVNLLESLIGKLANRLLQLPGVVGVRVKIAKLKIFDDCEVAIRVETGQW